MKQITNFLFKLLDIAMALSLAVMVILVFGNVVLRYVFNSGITWSEEISRFLFIYLVFLGAIGAQRDNQHLGMDTLVKRLPRPMKRIVYIISNILVIYTMYLVMDGSWDMTLLNMESTAPATGLPLSVIYFIGVFAAVCIGLILIFNTIRVIIDKNAVDELAQLHESEEELDFGNDSTIPAEGGHK